MRSRSHDGRLDETGAVSAELALGMPAVVGLLAVLLVCAVLGVDTLRTAEAARTGARAAARGETTSEVVRLVRRVAPAGSHVSVSRTGEWAEVAVRARLAGPLGVVAPVPVSARFSALAEPAG